MNLKQFSEMTKQGKLAFNFQLRADQYLEEKFVDFRNENDNKRQKFIVRIFSRYSIESHLEIH